MKEKSKLQKRVERLIAKADKQGYEYSDTELSMFDALGRDEWDEERVNPFALQLFERMYMRFFPNRP